MSSSHSPSLLLSLLLLSLLVLLLLCVDLLKLQLGGALSALPDFTASVSPACVRASVRDGDVAARWCAATWRRRTCGSTFVGFSFFFFFPRRLVATVSACVTLQVSDGTCRTCCTQPAVIQHLYRLFFFEAASLCFAAFCECK